jgi:hypothetical protein
VDRLVEAGGRGADSVAAAVADADVVITMLPADPQVTEVVLGKDGVLAHARPGTLLIDMSSVGPRTAVAIAEAGRAKGVRVLDAPVSGGEAGAVDAVLSIMAGGDADDFAAAEPLFRALGTTVVHVGPHGAGQTVKATPFSVLDRSRTREGHPPAEALRDTVRLAREVEELGYHRFWVSEHHGVPGVAGSAPTVLAAAVASATRSIRVGTGGVMLPNHQPLVVAEQFGVLESLFPGRIDMGLGRSVGFTDGVRKALGRDKDDADDFAGQLDELLDWFRGRHPPARTRGPPRA